MDVVRTSDDGEFAGRVAIVTGGSRGIGRAVADRFVSAGAAVVRVSRTGGPLGLPVSNDLSIAADVAELREMERVAQFTIGVFGRIDVLVCAAGWIGPLGATWEVKEAEWRRCLDTNLLGALFAMRSSLPTMINQQSGRIVVLASDAAIHSAPGQSAYNTSKAAVLGLTRSVANEVAHLGVTVNALCPGLVVTDMIAEFLAGDVPSRLRGNQERLLSKIDAHEILAPADVADMVLCLASDAARLITGQFVRLSAPPGRESSA